MVHPYLHFCFQEINWSAARILYMIRFGWLSKIFVNPLMFATLAHYA